DAPAQRQSGHEDRADQGERDDVAEAGDHARDRGDVARKQPPRLNSERGPGDDDGEKRRPGGDEDLPGPRAWQGDAGHAVRAREQPYGDDLEGVLADEDGPAREQ